MQLNWNTSLNVNMDYTLTSSLNPHSRVKSTTLILSFKWIKCSVFIVLVSTSASCFWVLQWAASSTPLWTWLRRKWNFIPMCLLLPYNTGFLARLIPDLLSIINLTGLITLIFRSCNKLIIQTAWHADKAPAMYSASQVDNATIGCLLKHQEMGPPRYSKKYPEVLFVNYVSTSVRVWIPY